MNRTLRTGTRVWVRTGTAENGNALLKAGWVVNARGPRVRVNLPGTGSADFNRADVTRIPA